MAATKPTFTKLKLVKNTSVKTITCNGIDIEVKQYLPVEEKLKLIFNVINSCGDENSFLNPLKADLFGNLELVYFYTNISFTDKQKEDPGMLYDTLLSSGLLKQIIDAIPADEYNDLITWIDGCIKSIYDFKNSAMGILEQISTDYENVAFDAQKIQQSLADPNNLALLRTVLTKLG